MGKPSRSCYDTSMDTDIRFLIVAFDGLRPDMVRDDLAPNLAAFCRQGVHFSDCRAVFPTETRVNQASLITGCQPGRHGMVANKFMEPAAGGYLNTADFAALSAAEAALGGILDAPSLGEVLHGAGGSLAVAGCGTPGGNRLLHNHAERLDGLNISLHGIEKSAAPAAAEALVAAVGPVPDDALPNRDRIDWLVDAYVDRIAPDQDPTVAILWFSDPDTPFHYRGIESAEATAAIGHADAAFGRILDWRRDTGRQDSLQIIAMSDHGHVATHGAPLDLAGRLVAAGFDLGEGGDGRLIPGTAPSLYLRDGAAQAAIAGWLQDQPWCGPLFARQMDGEALPAGTLPLAAAHLDHPRAGDLVMVLARDEAAGQRELPGRCLHDNPDIPEGCGLHGGLSPYEISATLALSGSRFGKARRIDGPAGIVDVMPTILHALGLADGPAMDGRVLLEAMAAGDGTAPPATSRQLSAEGRNGYAQGIQSHEVAGTRYLRAGHRHDGVALDEITL